MVVITLPPLLYPITVPHMANIPKGKPDSIMVVRAGKSNEKGEGD
jgi:hypothetical protein